MDPVLFENFLTEDGDLLRAKFQAFKFPETNFVLFKGIVNVCLDKCRGVSYKNYIFKNIFVAFFCLFVWEVQLWSTSLLHLIFMALEKLNKKLDFFVFSLKPSLKALSDKTSF